MDFEMSNAITVGGAAKAADMRAATKNPACKFETMKGFRVVVSYMVADAFALTVEESLWVRHHLAEAFASLESLTPNRLPLSVRKELLEGSYSRATAMADASEIGVMPLSADDETMYANLDDWTAVIMETITSCYNLRPMTESVMYGKIRGILMELGVGDESNPRGSRYLPTVVKARLAG